jgi:hypothetical protein
MNKARVHFSSKDYAIFDKKKALKSFAVFCQLKASIQFHTITLEDAVAVLKCSRSSLYRHIQVLNSLGYGRLENKTIILKGQLTKGSYKFNRFSLTTQKKRKKTQSVHMSVHIGKTLNETLVSLQGLKIVSNVLRQEKAIIQRQKANSKSNGISLTKGNNFGFMTLSNQRAAKILNFKSKNTGQKKLRKLQELEYFQMKHAYIAFSKNTVSDSIKKDIELGHPAIKLAKVEDKQFLVRQVGNQISAISHNHFGKPHYAFRENTNNNFFHHVSCKTLFVREILM